MRALKVNVTVAIQNPEQELIQDFSKIFIRCSNLHPSKTSISFPASLYRGGVTNAADRGLDMISNFGPAIQVKHLTLKEDLAEDIVEGIAAERIVVVCTQAEQNVINRIMKQVGLAEKIQGFVTLDDLNNCMI